jgi:site-specific DNA-methyltransferase (adenine-specific)
MIELLNCDCMEYMATCEDNAFDTTVTSPPYDNLRDYGKHSDWSEELWRDVISELYRITNPGGVVCWVVSDQVIDGSESGTSFRQALFAMECGFRLHDTMIWHKSGVRFPDANRYYDCFEYIFIFSKGKPIAFSPITDRKNKWAGTKFHGTDRQKDGSTKLSKGHNSRDIPDIGRRFNVWECPNPGVAGTTHPATFPEKLAYDLISSWTPKGGRIFDPFAGSGTTGLAAHKYGCDFVGTEIDPDYFKAAQERFDNETKQSAMF